MILLQDTHNHYLNCILSYSFRYRKQVTLSWSNAAKNSLSSQSLIYHSRLCFTSNTPLRIPLYISLLSVRRYYLVFILLFLFRQNLLLLSCYKRVHYMNQYYQFNPTIIISTLGIIYVFITVVFCKLFTKTFCI